MLAWSCDPGHPAPRVTARDLCKSLTIDALETGPFPICARLRATAPITEFPAANCWFATRWADIEAINRSPDFTAASDDAPVNHAFGRPNVLTTEGAVQADLGAGIEPHTRPRPAAAHIDSLVRPLAKAQLKSVRASDDRDLMEGCSEPLPALARSFGLHDVDAATLPPSRSPCQAACRNQGTVPAPR